MAAASQNPAGKRSEARERLLASATELFYAEGINGVGVDRIVSASRVTLATFYRHFPSKQDLVVGYLEGIHDAIAARASDLLKDAEGRDLVRTLGEEVNGELARAGFRGCAFINAASEFEDPKAPVRRVVAAHRLWYFELMREAFAGAGHGLPANAARHFLMLRDGAVTAGYLDSATAARRTFNRGVEGLLRSIDMVPPADEGEDRG